MLDRLAEKDYQGLTILLVNNPKLINGNFDFNDCAAVSSGDLAQDGPLKQLQVVRRRRCRNDREFLQEKSEIKLAYSKIKFSGMLTPGQKKEIRMQKAVGVFFIEKFDRAVESMDWQGRHEVFQYLRVKFAPLLKELSTNWDSVNIEQWSKPKKESPGLSRYSFNKNQAETADHAALSGYRFSYGYRTNILDHLDRLELYVE
ncbi:MAG: hypothetical protein ACE5GM_01345 [bacterium]